jgi:hypothetical protein
MSELKLAGMALSILKSAARHPLSPERGHSASIVSSRTGAPSRSNGIAADSLATFVIGLRKPKKQRRACDENQSWHVSFVGH